MTICTQRKLCLFGSIADGTVRLNVAGQVVQSWWWELEKRFSVISLDKFVLMPNHLHGILTIRRSEETAGPESERISGEPPSLGDAIGWFKAMTTNSYIRGVKQAGWTPFHRRLWQRNYYEHVIRNQQDLTDIRQYILHNPMRWENDRENPDIARQLHRTR